MRQDDTKQKILREALWLFSTHGYDAVGVGQIADAVGIRASSLYNHYPSKQAIFDAIVENTAAEYDRGTARISIHVGDAARDEAGFCAVDADALVEKVRQIFLYSLHDETVSRFRRMMTIEQFRDPKLSAMVTQRYVDRLNDYHAEIFRALIAAGKLRAEDPQALALLYTSAINVLLSVCDREPEKEAECLNRLEAHVRLFWRAFTKEAERDG